MLYVFLCIFIFFVFNFLLSIVFLVFLICPLRIFPSSFYTLLFLCTFFLPISTSNVGNPPKYVHVS